jgi:hypothetical protein
MMIFDLEAAAGEYGEFGRFISEIVSMDFEVFCEVG